MCTFRKVSGVKSMTIAEIGSYEVSVIPTVQLQGNKLVRSLCRAAQTPYSLFVLISNHVPTLEIKMNTDLNHILLLCRLPEDIHS